MVLSRTQLSKTIEYRFVNGENPVDSAEKNANRWAFFERGEFLRYATCAIGSWTAKTQFIAAIASVVIWLSPNCHSQRWLGTATPCRPMLLASPSRASTPKLTHKTKQRTSAVNFFLDYWRSQDFHSALQIFIQNLLRFNSLVRMGARFTIAPAQNPLFR